VRRPSGAVAPTLLAIAAGSVALTPASAATSAYTFPPGPTASFVWIPNLPHPRERVELVSTSTDVSSPITSFAWDLSGGAAPGPFQAGGPSISTTFASVGNHIVRLRVSDAAGRSNTVAETVGVATPEAVLMVPFPIVRFVSIDKASGVKLRLLSVKAPPGAKIVVRCEHRGCPRRSAKHVVSTRPARARWTRFRSFERFLRAGVSLIVRVTRDNEVGSYTRFQVRRSKLPRRVDACLDSATAKPLACPSP
jgi:PKD repeat protein